MRAVKQFHFLVWPDFGCPDHTEQLIEFVSDVRMHVPLPRFHASAKGPILVHCRYTMNTIGSWLGCSAA
jgi:protein-tyrosine phosphatase